MKTIAKNTLYDLEVNSEKNRAYLKVKGFWRNREAASDYLNDWHKALKFLKPGFTLLTDATEMKTAPKDVKELHQEAQTLVVKAGIKKVAEVISEDIFSKAQLDKLATDSTMPKLNFTSKEEADQFLDTVG